jgi:hemolysin activation/secretion protein
MRKTNQIHKLKGIGLAFLLFSPLVFAQTTPDAGALMRQTEQEFKQPFLPFAQPSRSLPVVSVPHSGEATLTVNRFQFAGNQRLSSAQLDHAVEPYLNRPLTFAQLQQAADAVAAAYRESGWVVRAYLPKQSTHQGVVTIQVTEAVYGKAFVLGTPALRMASQRLLDMVAAAQKPGQAMSSRAIDRALLLMDDLPGVNVAGSMVEGENAGETDVMLAISDEPLMTGSAGVDNHGSRSTGMGRLSGNFSFNSPMHLGDALAVNLLKTQGSDYQRLAYSLPMGLDGLRGGVQMSHMQYRLLGEFASLNGSGTASTGGVNVSYPLVRSQYENINVALSYDAKTFDNVNSTGPQSNYKVNVVNASFNLSELDNWAGGGANSASVALTSGQVNLNGSANQSADATGANTQGGYQKISLSASRVQTLTADLSMYVATSLQAASKNLDSSEKLYLGGASGVRAYPSSEGGGSDGYTLTAELRQKVNAQTTVTGFYDHGHAKAFHDNTKVDGSGLNSGVAPNSYALKGYGLSVAWQPEKNIDIKATLAKRIGTSPIASPSSGMDGDGTRKINRLWVGASIAF